MSGGESLGFAIRTGFLVDRDVFKPGPLGESGQHLPAEPGAEVLRAAVRRKCARVGVALEEYEHTRLGQVAEHLVVKVSRLRPGGLHHLPQCLFDTAFFARSRPVAGDHHAFHAYLSGVTPRVAPDKMAAFAIGRAPGVRGSCPRKTTVSARGGSGESPRSTSKVAGPGGVPRPPGPQGGQRPTRKGRGFDLILGNL